MKQNFQLCNEVKLWSLYVIYCCCMMLVIMKHDEHSKKNILNLSDRPFVTYKFCLFLDILLREGCCITCWQEFLTTYVVFTKIDFEILKINKKHDICLAWMMLCRAVRTMLCAFILCASSLEDCFVGTTVNITLKRATHFKYTPTLYFQYECDALPARSFTRTTVMLTCVVVFIRITVIVTIVLSGPGNVDCAAGWGCVWAI